VECLLLRENPFIELGKDEDKKKEKNALYAIEILKDILLLPDADGRGICLLG
jgi:hypothetical protein